MFGRFFGLFCSIGTLLLLESNNKIELKWALAAIGGQFSKLLVSSLFTYLDLVIILDLYSYYSKCLIFVINSYSSWVSFNEKRNKHYLLNNLKVYFQFKTIGFINYTSIKLGGKAYWLSAVVS